MADVNERGYATFFGRPRGTFGPKTIGFDGALGSLGLFLLPLGRPPFFFSGVSDANCERVRRTYDSLGVDILAHERGQEAQIELKGRK